MKSCTCPDCGNIHLTPEPLPEGLPAKELILADRVCLCEWCKFWHPRARARRIPLPHHIKRK